MLFPLTLSHELSSLGSDNILWYPIAIVTSATQFGPLYFGCSHPDPLPRVRLRELKEETGMKLGGMPQLLDAQDIMIPDVDRHVARLTYLMYAEGVTRLSGEYAKYEWRALEDAKLLNVDDYLRNTPISI